MKKAKWLVELDLFTDTEEELIKAIKRSGREVKTLQYIPMDDNLVKKCSEGYEQDDCVVFYGSLNFGRKLRKTSWIPGVYLKDKEYECTSYYPVFGDELIHKNYIMMPFGDLMRRKDFLFEHFGSHLFIRPNSGYKNFTGTILDVYNFDDGIKMCGFYDVEPDLLVIVSDVKNFQKEWRFVIVDGEVVSGSLYRDWTIGPETLSPKSTTKEIILLNSKGVSEYCTDEKAFEYAQKVSKLYNPDNAWTIDIALTDSNEYKTIEIGCFSCAGMYGNNLDVIVEKVSKAAENEWKEYQI